MNRNVLLVDRIMDGDLNMQNIIRILEIFYIHKNCNKSRFFFIYNHIISTYIKCVRLRNISIIKCGMYLVISKRTCNLFVKLLDCVSR